MSVNGKRDNFNRSDLIAAARKFGIKNAGEILDRGIDTVIRWPEYADAAGVSGSVAKSIASTHRLSLSQ
jgi:serine/threonine-protein kinase HipA